MRFQTQLLDFFQVLLFYDKFGHIDGIPTCVYF